MSMSGLTGFGEGFANSRNRKADREQRTESNKRMDTYLDAMKSMGAEPQAGPSDGAGGNSTMPSTNGGSGYGRAAPASYEGGDNDTIAGLLRAHEGAGDPSTLFGHSQRGGRFDGVDVSAMTLAELREFQNPSGEYGQWVKAQLEASGQPARVATPAGFGQIVGRTARATQEQLNLPDDTIFNEATQTQMVNHLARQRLVNASSPAAKRAAMRAEWEGFKNVSDAQLDAAIANFERNGSELTPRPLGVSVN